MKKIMFLLAGVCLAVHVSAENGPAYFRPKALPDIYNWTVSTVRTNEVKWCPRIKSRTYFNQVYTPPLFEYVPMQSGQIFFAPKIGLSSSVATTSTGFINELRADSVNGTLVYYPLTHSRLSGFSAGVVVGNHFNEWLDLLLDASFVMGAGNKAEQTESRSKIVTNREGSRIEVIGFDRYIDKFNTVKLGLSARFQPIRSYRFGFLLGLGPSFNFITSGRGTKTVVTATEEYNVKDEPLKLGKGKTDDYNNVDVSIVANPSIFVNLDRDGFLRLVLDAKFEWGTQDMFTTERREFLRANNIDVLGTQKWRSTALSLSLEVCFARQR